jgi:hypothetical protein
MPLLRAENCFIPPSPTEQQIALSNRVNNSKREVYANMLRILPNRGSSWSRREHLSAKAIYQVEGQSQNEFTRAWLSRSGDYGVSDHGVINLHTDRVVAVNNKAIVIDGSEFKHFALGKTNMMYTDHYLSIESEQLIDLMNGAKDTLRLIEEASRVTPAFIS